MAWRSTDLAYLAGFGDGEGASVHAHYRSLGKVLIELAYEAADCSDRKALTSDPLELARMEALLQKLRCARIAVQFALDSRRAASDLGIPQAA
jgi:hypothetical protein